MLGSLTLPDAYQIWSKGVVIQNQCVLYFYFFFVVVRLPPYKEVVFTLFICRRPAGGILPYKSLVQSAAGLGLAASFVYRLSCKHWTPAEVCEGAWVHNHGRNATCIAGLTSFVLLSVQWSDEIRLTPCWLHASDPSDESVDFNTFYCCSRCMGVKLGLSR
jgi:hypothetical protein